MGRVMLRVAYDGTDFHGWQIQPGKRTVESELIDAIAKATGQTVEIIGAGRTDAGVHSLGNVAVFDTDSTIPPDKFMYVLNTLLPEDVSVTQSKEVPADFHPRHCNSRKTYRYRFYESRVKDPNKRRIAMQSVVPLNVDKMNEAASYLVGEHDFKSFCCVHTQATSTVRTIYDASVKRDGNDVIIELTGAGFLYNMVRIIAGSLAEVGSGKYEPIHIKEILEMRDRTVGGPTAEPQGLTMVGIEFEE